MYDRYMSKVLVVTHVKELIEQDYEAIVEYWPGAPIGIYSASLNKKQTENRILCCGVQSIAKPETYQFSKLHENRKQTENQIHQSLSLKNSLAGRSNVLTISCCFKSF